MYVKLHVGETPECCCCLISSIANQAICVFINISANVKVMLFTAQGNQAHLEPSLEDLGSLKNILTICDECNPAPICFILFNGK